MAELPTGTVTFLFTDIEGSTRLLQALGERWPPILEEHNRLLRGAIRDAGGIDLRTEGDAFFAVFRSAPAAIEAATEAQRALYAQAWPAEGAVRVRMGLHTGEGAIGGDDYVGLDVHRAARIASAAHGGQVLLSALTAELARDELPDGVAVEDLGSHRLKDLARPERIVQLRIEGLPSEFPSIRSLETPTNLPAERTAFVGRERETARVRELLRGPGLLTLTGPGGAGKTRLAVHTARSLLDDYRDGVFLAELAPIADPLLVAPTIADALGVRVEGARPALATLIDHFRDREVLLVLDNFEQVLAAAPVVGDLLTAASRLRVLATSREPLHVAGEQELAVPPLGLPERGRSGTAEGLAEFESVALFVQRATAADPGFALTDANAPAVAEICARLDGLPLAIELAASRVKLLSPEAILERLEHRLELLTGGPVDVPARQRTLREAIAWSHDLLDEPERALFRRLSVFAGGWSLDAAAAVDTSGAELASDPLELLGSLVDKNLVTRFRAPDGIVRFGMLESIREFGLDRLAVAGEVEATRGRHAAWSVATAEAAEPHLRLDDQQRWLDDLEAEHDNLRAALRWSIDAGDADASLRLVAALWRFWHLHGHLAEGTRWAREALALPTAAARNSARAAALTALGSLVYWQEDVPGFRAAYEEALDIARELGDRVGEAEGLYNLAFAPAYEGDGATAVAMFEQARDLFEELGIDRGVADAKWILGILSRLGGDIERGRALADEALRMHREAGDRFGTTIGLYAVGRTAFAQGDVATAESSFLEALEYDVASGTRTGIGVVLDNLAAQAGARGDHLRALRLAGASDAIKEEAGGHAPPALIDIPDPREAAREVLGEDAVTAAWEEGRAMPLEAALAYARQRDFRAGD